MDIPYGFGLIARAVFGIARPRNRILGSEFSGQIESIGTKVTRFKIRGKVFGLSGASLGCHADRVLSVPFEFCNDQFAPN